ncbi:MAG: ribonuclease III [Candidatus Zipacnadales bacterium]
MVDLDSANRLCAHLKIHGADPEAIARALRHPSYVQEVGWASHESNQRLEFLGDAVLDLLLADYLVRHGEHRSEGELTKLKSELVREPALARVARRLNLGEFLLLGRGEEESGGRDKDSILADCMEALIGALYLTGGLEAARRVVMEGFAEDLAAALNRGPADDAKTRLQELIQDRTKQLPSYCTTFVGGPAHEPWFVSKCGFRGVLLGQGGGRSKREAEQAAASEALSDLDALWAAIERAEKADPTAG